jgi:hypothetical protein
MNIDLLFTRAGAAGLISSSNWIKKVAGVLLDTQNGLITIEYADTDFLELNIPVEAEYFSILDFNQSIHLGSVVNGRIAQAYQVPLVFADDPYRNQSLAPKQDDNPLSAFSTFVKACVAGQPVHRDDLGNESTMGCILGDASPNSLEFAPHLARRHAFEVKPQLDLSHLPTLGLGGGGGGGGAVRRTDDSKGKKK